MTGFENSKLLLTEFFFKKNGTKSSAGEANGAVLISTQCYWSSP